MSVGLDILIRHSFTNLWVWITAWVPWPLLLSLRLFVWQNSLQFYIRQSPINTSKSNIMHFRNPSASQSDVVFSVNQEVLSYTTQYKYLGVVLTEHLDYAITAKIIAQSANRALGLLIAKSKAFGGFQYDPFTKLYESIVCPVISYGAAVWATQSYNCINAVQN